MRTLAVALLALAIALPAGAGLRTPLVPTFIGHLIRTRAGALAYAPTRAPSGYRYLSYGWNPATRQVTIRLHDRHYAPANARHTVLFTAEPFAGPLASCPAGKQKTIQYDGNKVYWDGTTGWRCVRGSRGNVRLGAAGPNLPDVAIALIVASAKRI